MKTNTKMVLVYDYYVVILIILTEFYLSLNYNYPHLVDNITWYKENFT